MVLHHRPHIDDIRSAYDGDRSRSEINNERASRSVSSDKSSRILPIGQPSSLSGSRSRRQAGVSNPDYSTSPMYFQDREPQQSPRSSFNTYASTSESEEELQEDTCEYNVPELTPPCSELCAIPATPSEFSELFPSSRKLAVRHDDSTLDGNMNLRIDTEVLLQGGQHGQMTLFHLRMHDLKNREFSLRRYCRDSGREVCHSERKAPKSPMDKRPGLQRSLSNAFNGIRPKSEQKVAGAVSSLKRHDSGYGSMHSTEVDDEGRPRTAEASDKSPSQRTNVIRLEFSNYAQVAIKRSGNRGSQRYEFEYWGTSYAWRRSIRKIGNRKEISYHLHAVGNDNPLAYIVPTLLSVAQAAEEESKGGWIAPSMFWIADKWIIEAQKDIADVVVASGLIALVDDSIQRHFGAQESKQLLIPVPKLQIGVEYIGPRRLLSEIFRRGDANNNNAQHKRRPSLPFNRSASSGNGPSANRMPSTAIRQQSY